MISNGNENTENKNGKTNDPEKAIDTPKEVAQSNDEKIDEDFPGYPHYPAKEDIINNDEKVDADVEKLTRSNKVTQDNLKDISK